MNHPIVVGGAAPAIDPSIFLPVLLLAIGMFICLARSCYFWGFAEGQSDGGYSGFLEGQRVSRKSSDAIIEQVSNEVRELRIANEKIKNDLQFQKNHCAFLNGCKEDAEKKLASKEEYAKSLADQLHSLQAEREQDSQEMERLREKIETHVSRLITTTKELTELTKERTKIESWFNASPLISKTPQDQDEDDDDDEGDDDDEPLEPLVIPALESLSFQECLQLLVDYHSLHLDDFNEKYNNCADNQNIGWHIENALRAKNTEEEVAHEYLVIEKGSELDEDDLPDEAFCYWNPELPRTLKAALQLFVDQASMLMPNFQAKYPWTAKYSGSNEKLCTLIVRRAFDAHDHGDFIVIDKKDSGLCKPASEITPKDIDILGERLYRSYLTNAQKTEPTYSNYHKWGNSMAVRDSFMNIAVDILNDPIAYLSLPKTESKEAR